MGVLVLVAAVVALLNSSKKKKEQLAKFNLGDIVHTTISPDGRQLKILNRSLKADGWHYEVTAHVLTFAMPDPGDFWLTWWTHESNLAS